MIRETVEGKLPDGALCEHSKSDSSLDMVEVKRKAESVLSDLAKHLVALKDSEGRLNEEAKRSYLQVSILVSIKQLVDK